MPIEITQTRTNQGLLVDGGGVHQEPREIEAPRGKTRSEFKFDGALIDGALIRGSCFVFCRVNLTE